MVGSMGSSLSVKRAAAGGDLVLRDLLLHLPPPISAGADLLGRQYAGAMCPRRARSLDQRNWLHSLLTSAPTCTST